MYANKVVEQAKKWLGKNEKDGSHKEIIDLYNKRKPLPRGYKVKYTDAWCATFVSAVAIALGYDYNIPVECSCGKMIALLQEKGIWDENDARVPKAGEIIFYYWKDNGKGDCTGFPNHVGIVEKVSNGIITVIEGNLNNAVERREIAINGKTIRGYGIPAYEEEKPVEEPVNKPTEEPKKPSKSITDVAKDVINGKYGNGAARKSKLEAEGYVYAEVQAEVNRLLKVPSTPAKKSVTEVAKEVINGKYGNGAERRRRIPAETGYTYAEVQKEVNRLLK